MGRAWNPDRLGRHEGLYRGCTVAVRWLWKAVRTKPKPKKGYLLDRLEQRVELWVERDGPRAVDDPAIDLKAAINAQAKRRELGNQSPSQET